MKHSVIVLFTSVWLAACAAGLTPDPLAQYVEVDAVTILDAPGPTPESVAPENRTAVARGKYLVELLGCGACHTDGALVGEPQPDRSLAGSRTGIAYSNPLRQRNPGVVYPPNITPDKNTGIGSWSDQQIIAALRAGSGRHINRRILVMPWQGYARLSNDDAFAIVAYLRNIQPVRHRVPQDVQPGRSATEPFVHFGVYRSL